MQSDRLFVRLRSHVRFAFRFDLWDLQRVVGRKRGKKPSHNRGEIETARCKYYRIETLCFFYMYEHKDYEHTFVLLIVAVYTLVDDGAINPESRRTSDSKGSCS